MSSTRTSYSQFFVMVDFMEKNGDLSKPSGGPRGRQWVIKKWKELAEKLNSEGTGESRSEEKWRKCKESQENEMEEMENIPDETEEVMMLAHQTPTSQDEYWNTPGSSTDPVPRIPPARSATPPRSTTPHKSPKPTTPPRSPLRSTSPPQPPPQKKKKLAKSIEDLFIRCEMNAREDNRERDRMYVELERERIRQRDIELRQRDTELQLQAQWLEFMKEALNVLERFMDRNK